MQGYAEEYSSGQPIKTKKKDRSKPTSEYQLGKTAANLEQQKRENEQTAQMNAIQAQQIQQGKMELDQQMNQINLLVQQMQSQAQQTAPPPPVPMPPPPVAGQMGGQMGGQMPPETMPPQGLM